VHLAVKEWCTDEPTALAKYGFIGDWDISAQQGAQDLFHKDVADTCNPPIENWDTSRMENMNRMFKDARAFNRPIGGWDVSRVISFREMFYGASSFNRPLDSWHFARKGLALEEGIDMQSMFDQDFAFNQPLDKWDVSNVINMDFMFRSSAFNQPLKSWDVSRMASYVPRHWSQTRGKNGGFYLTFYGTPKSASGSVEMPGPESENQKCMESWALHRHGGTSWRGTGYDVC